MKDMNPRFIIVGAMKSGNSLVLKIIICRLLCTTKNINYFDIIINKLILKILDIGRLKEMNLIG